MCKRWVNEILSEDLKEKGLKEMEKWKDLEDGKLMGLLVRKLCDKDIKIESKNQTQRRITFQKLIQVLKENGYRDEASEIEPTRHTLFFHVFSFLLNFLCASIIDFLHETDEKEVATLKRERYLINLMSGIEVCTFVFLILSIC